MSTMKTIDNSQSLGTKTIDNSQTLGAAGAVLTVASDIVFSGLSNTGQSYDNIVVSTPFAASLSLPITIGMVFMFTSTSAVSSLAFTSIPTTPYQSYVFTLIFNPSSANTAWYFTGSTITVNGYSSTLRGTTTLPVSYTHIIQSITIIATSPTTFIALNSVQGY